MNKQIKNRNRYINTEWLPEGLPGGIGEMSEGKWEIQVSSYGVNKSLG